MTLLFEQAVEFLESAHFDKEGLAWLKEYGGLSHKALEALADIETRAAEAVSLLEREKVRAENLRPQAPPTAEPEQPEFKPAPKVVKPAEPPQIDTKTTSMLKGVAMKPQPPDKSYSDISLAQDLLTLQTDTPLPGVDIKPEQRWIPLQRISLAGKFLNEAVADPLVPKEQERQHEAVRFPIIKSAITDSTLVTALTHPLRTLVNDLMLKSATSRITGTAETSRATLRGSATGSRRGRGRAAPCDRAAHGGEQPAPRVGVAHGPVVDGVGHVGMTRRGQGLLRGQVGLHVDRREVGAAVREDVQGALPQSVGQRCVGDDKNRVH